MEERFPTNVPDGSPSKTESLSMVIPVGGSLRLRTLIHKESLRNSAPAASVALTMTSIRDSSSALSARVVLSVLPVIVKGGMLSAGPMILKVCESPASGSMAASLPTVVPALLFSSTKDGEMVTSVGASLAGLTKRSAEEETVWAIPSPKCPMSLNSMVNVSAPL